MKSWRKLWRKKELLWKSLVVITVRELTHICSLTLLSCLNTVFTLKSIPTVLTKAEVKESSAYLPPIYYCLLSAHWSYLFTGRGRKFSPRSCCRWSAVWTCSRSSGRRRPSARIVQPRPSERRESLVRTGGLAWWEPRRVMTGERISESDERNGGLERQVGCSANISSLSWLNISIHLMFTQRGSLSISPSSPLLSQHSTIT